MSGRKVYIKFEIFALRESLGSEYGTEIIFSMGVSDGNVENKFRGYSGVSYKVASYARVVMVVGILTMDAYEMAVAEASECVSDMRRCCWLWRMSAV